MQKIAIFLILSVQCNIIICSQNTTNVDTNYIGYYSNKMGIYSYISNKINNLLYTNVEVKYSLSYYPNSWGTFGIGAYYKWIDLSASFSSFGRKDPDIYGYTSRFDVQSHFYLRTYIIGSFLQFYKSFFSNSNIITYENKNVYLRPDISMTHIGGNIFRILKPDKFSPKAVFSQSEIQKKSVGSWVVGTKFTVFAISADSSFSSSLLDNFFLQDYRLLGFSCLLAGIKGGYMYNLKRKYWTFNFSIIFGFGSQFQLKRLVYKPDRTFAHTTTGFIQNVRLAACYSKNKMYFIFAAISDNHHYPLSKFVRIEHTFGRIDLILGYRLYDNSKK